MIENLPELLGKVDIVNVGAGLIVGLLISKINWNKVGDICEGAGKGSGGLIDKFFINRIPGVEQSIDYILIMIITNAPMRFLIGLIKGVKKNNKLQYHAVIEAVGLINKGIAKLKTIKKK